VESLEVEEAAQPPSTVQSVGVGHAHAPVEQTQLVWTPAQLFGADSV
jgi:hypothetical protein